MPYLDGYGSGYYPLEDQTPTIPETEDEVQGRPDCVLEFAFEDFGGEFTWWDESSRLRRWNMTRGRASELDEVQAGTSSVTISDQDGHFASDNPDSPYAGQLNPRRAIRLSARLGDGAEPLMAKWSHAGETDALRARDLVEPLFTHFVDAFPHEWHISDHDATATLSGVDGAGTFLAEAPMRTLQDPITGIIGPYPLSGNIGDCILLLLSIAGWPGAAEGLSAPYQSEWIDVEAAETSITNPLLSTDKVLSIIQLLARTDGGTFFIDRFGRATYRAPHVPRAIVGVWGEEEGESPYSGITDEPEVANLVNEVTVHDVTTQQEFIRVDGASRQSYGVRERTFQMASTASLGVRADDILASRAQPRKRIAGLQPQGKDSLTLWRQSVPRELRDRAIVRRRPMYGGLMERAVTLEGIHIDSPSKKRWQVDWNLAEDTEGPPNLLSANQAGLEEGDATGWLAEESCTISASITRALFGSASLLIHAEQVFGEDPPTSVSCITVPPTDVAVTAGEVYRAGCYFFGAHLAGPGNNLRVGVDIVWYNAALAVVGTDSSPNTAGQWNRWTPVNVAAQAPVGAVHAALRLRTVGVEELPGLLRDVWADALFLKLAA